MEYKLSDPQHVEEIMHNHSKISNSIEEFLKIAKLNEDIENLECAKYNHYRLFYYQGKFQVYVEFYYEYNSEIETTKVYYIPLEAICSFISGNRLAPLYWKHVLKGNK